MTAYIITPEVHAQIVDALDNGLPEVRVDALAMLKAMKPVESCGFAYKHHDYKGSMIGAVIGAAGDWAPNEIPLYAKEQQ